MKNRMTMPYRILSFVMMIVLMVTLLPETALLKESKVQAATTLNNPRIVKDDSMMAGQKVTWDCVWFGSYPQTEVVSENDSARIAALEKMNSYSETKYEKVSASKFQQIANAGYNGNGDASVGGERYRRIKRSDATGAWDNEWNYKWKDDTSYHYFKYEPIKWRVLNVNNGRAFLLADKVLDCQKFNTRNADGTWENRTIRSWLNNYGSGTNTEGIDYSSSGFLNRAFTTTERNAIVTTAVKNENNLSSGTAGGNNTSDKIFLLSESEIYRTDMAVNYGFARNNTTNDEARRSKSSTFAYAMGSTKGEGNLYTGVCHDWWLRSPGKTTNYICHVTNGSVDNNGSSGPQRGYGVRPALNLNLSATEQYTFAGTQCSKESTDNPDTPGNGGGDDNNKPDSGEILNSFDKGSYATSTKGRYGLEKFIDKADFANVKRTANNSKWIIPGLEQTNMGTNACKKMVPQGVCEAGDYLLISAYCKDESHNSVMYVLDYKTAQYITTIVLNTKCHVGALSYADKKVYIADSTNDEVKILGLGTIKKAVQTRKDCVYVKMTESHKVGVNPSFLGVFGGVLYVGNFSSPKEVGKEQARKQSYMLAYPLPFNKQKLVKVNLPVETQGIGFWERGGATYILCSCSYGKGNRSKLYYNLLEKTDSGAFVCKNGNFKAITTPNMGEDVCMPDGSNVLCTYESASNAYLKESDKDTQPCDRVISYNVSKVLQCTPDDSYKADVNTFSSKSMMRAAADTEEITGSCGEFIDYTLTPDGELILTGDGAMDDYTGSAVPWEKYKHQIRSVYVGADISSVSPRAFEGCPNLEKVTVSSFSDPTESFTIDDSAFNGCVNLETVNLPDKNYKLAEDAFTGCSDNLELQSDSDDVAVYGGTNGIDTHTHDYQYIRTIAPDCGNSGYDEYQCSCGDTIARNETSSNDYHNYKMIEKEEADCENSGSISYRCTVCGSSYDEEIPAIGHRNTEVRNKKEASCEKAGYTGDTYCNDCHKVISKGKATSATGHAWDTGRVTKKPTYTKEGEKTFTCTKCKKTRTEKIAVVKRPDIKVSRIKISGISTKIAEGKKIRLTAAISPSKATNKKLYWKSSNTKVATITQSGIVTMKKKSSGKKVIITATARDGSRKRAVYQITSMKGVVKKVTIKGSTSVKAGKSLNLKAKVTATKKANTKLRWSSSNTKYATVSQSGKVSTKKAGKRKTVKITAMATDGSGKSKTVKIKIK